ncbi:ATP-binding protein, partial [Hydrogenimonas sp.]
REFILLAQIVKRAWMGGEGLDMGTLISRIITPPFDKIGVLPLESFYPPSERFKLAARFNAVLASPTFENWLEGEPLEIGKLLYDANQKSRISIFSIAHLSERERMFFVTLLLNAVLGWMRRQSGTGRLRALLYMDEIYGYFPPSKNPPSKEPMMLLLKQARAFGVGVVLSTQNPVDLDYKGLSNIGTWFIGRLQTKQDIAKVIEGLSGKIGGSLGRDAIERLLSSLPKRTFFLKSAHIDAVRIFQTRWVLSYLKGPLKKAEIARLMHAKKSQTPAAATPSPEPAPKTPKATASTAPILSPAIPQRFDVAMRPGGEYLPALAAKGSVRFFNAARGIDLEDPLCLLHPLASGERAVEWERAEPCDEDFTRAPAKPSAETAFATLPSFLLSAKSLKAFEKGLKEHLYATRRLELFRCRPLKAESRPGESLEDFKARLVELLEERRSVEAEKIEARYARKLQTLEERYRRAMQKVEKEKADVSNATTGSILDAGMALFGAFFGSKRSAASKVSQAIKGGSRVLKEKADVERAQERADAVLEKIEALKLELEEKLDALEEKYALQNYEVETFFIKPRRSDVRVEAMALYWRWSV